MVNVEQSTADIIAKGQKDITEITPQFSDNAHKILCERYLTTAGDVVHVQCSRCGKYHETPTDMLKRASFGNFAYYNMMARLDFLPNSPTLFNAGLNNGGTFSACFKFDIQDALLGEDSIMDVATKAAAVQKWGGGVGFCFSAIREQNAPIRSTHGRACGPIAVMRVYHSISYDMITQGGKRRGAQMAILHWTHPDIRQFIHCKDEDPQHLSTFNLSVAVTNDFMEKAIHNQQSDEGLLLQEIAESACKTGDPGLYFLDQAEKHNPTPWLGELTGTNPCGEVPLLNNEPCNLGSINLNNFVIQARTSEDLDQVSPIDYFSNQIDWNRLRSTVTLAVSFLNEILDENTFPYPSIEQAAHTTRKLGLGVMGYADLMTKLGLHYDTDEAVALGSNIMHVIQGAAHLASTELANAYGPFPGTYLHPDVQRIQDMKQKDAKVKELGLWRRNATLTCVAPTGTIAILAGASSGIEPPFALENIRTMDSGTQMVERAFSANGHIPHIAENIHWTWHVQHQAAIQKDTDLAVSKTINVFPDSTPATFFSAFKLMWLTGCKGGTIYRDGSHQGQPLQKINQSTAPNANSIAKNSPSYYHGRKRLPATRPAIRHHFDVGGTEGYFDFGLYADGMPGEMFITCSKQGSTIDGLLDAFAISFSMGVQHGVPLETLLHKMIGRRFEPAGITPNKDIPLATSIIDYIGRWATQHFFHSTDAAETTSRNAGDVPLAVHDQPTQPFRSDAMPDDRSDTGMLCPWCGSRAISQEGCMVCIKDCGWTTCA